MSFLDLFDKFDKVLSNADDMSAHVSAAASVDDPDTEGDTAALASHFSNFASQEEERLIGKPRASGLYSACIRKHVLGTLFNRKEKSYVSFKDKILFGYGNAIHYWLQNTPDIFGDRRLGWWECSACKKTVKFGRFPERETCKCGAHRDAFVYREHVLQEEFFSGHPDMFLDCGDGIARVAEFKSINGSDFENLTVPLINNVWQLSSYMDRCSRDKSLPIRIDGSKGYLFYITKRLKKEVFPLKGFVVKRDPDLLSRINQKIDQYAKAIKSRSLDQLPELDMACQRNPQSYQARNCAVQYECFKNR